MPTRNSPVTAPDIDILTLSCGQIAVALNIAGLPARWRRLPTQALVDLAAKGIAKIGLDEVLRINTESHHILTALYQAAKTSEADVSATRSQLRRIWASDRSRQNATDAAWTIFHPTSSQASARDSAPAEAVNGRTGWS